MTPPETPADGAGATCNNGGAPVENQNATQHGRWSTLGSLPPGCTHIRKLCAKLRNQLEQAVTAEHGEVSLLSAATIQTAVRHERHAQLAQKWLKDNPDINVETRLAISRDIASASEKRDKCLRLLNIDRKRTANPWDSLHAAAALPGPQTNATQCDAQAVSNPDAA
jgi:hypothetical protein